jgi:hypothetical protein
MTVGELREALEDYDDDDKVVFAYNYGDRGRTVVCDPAENVDGDSLIRWSGYHGTAKIVEDDGALDSEEDGDARVVVIS